MISDEFDMTAPPPPAQPAATVVVFRRDVQGGPAQILMVERVGTLAFAGGAAVFPGGKVDPADIELAAVLNHDLQLDDAAARVAAVRETLEETGLVIGIHQQVDAPTALRARRAILSHGRLADVLDEHGWTLDLASLVPWARWLPTHKPVRVYDTRFYLADLGTGAVDLAADATENRHLFWTSAAEALELANAGKIKVIFPTRRNLERLALWGDFESCRDHALATPILTVSPVVEDRGGQKWLTIPAEAGYPVNEEPLETANRG